MFKKAAALPLACAAQAAAAQDFPDRPITIVVPVPPGGIVDLAARLASEPCRPAWASRW